MRVTARKATVSDAPVLARLRWRYRIEEDAGPREPGPDRAGFAEFFTTWMVDNLATHVPYLVEVDGRAAGMAWLVLSSRLPSPEALDRRTGDVQSMYVLPELRNSGIGAALLRTVLAAAKDRELQHVTVHSSDRAMPFYVRMGFDDHRNWLQWTP